MNRPGVGVAVSSFNRPDMLARCVTEWRKWHDGPLVVVDDGSDPPVPNMPGVDVVRFPENRGIAAAKNACIEALEVRGVEHMFLADSDTWAIRKNWADPYCDHPQPFLIHAFETAPSHWQTKATPHGDLLSWDKPRGCLMYVHAPTVLPVVGGLHTAFGKHGGEHGDWADRIHKAGLTSAPHLSLPDSPFYCADEDQAGISSVQYTQQWRHVDPNRLPLYADYKAADVPVLVPRRNDHSHRDHLWRWTQQAFWNQLDGYRIVEGHHIEGPFNRSLALNLAADLAGNWDVAVIADSDAFVPPEQLNEAVWLARQTNRLVAAFNQVHEVGEKDTRDLLAGNIAPRTVPAERIRTRELETQSVMVVFPRNCWEQIRGFDPEHRGWGSEDCSAWLAATIATGKPLRVDGPVYSLWHEPASREHHGRNIERFKQYRRARTLADIHRLRTS